jgi:hypothetical protein
LARFFKVRFPRIQLQFFMASLAWSVEWRFLAFTTIRLMSAMELFSNYTNLAAAAFGMGINIYLTLMSWFLFCSFKCLNRFWRVYHNRILRMVEVTFVDSVVFALPLIHFSISFIPLSTTALLSPLISSKPYHENYNSINFKLFNQSLPASSSLFSFIH